MKAQKSNFGAGTVFSHHRHIERYRLPLHLHQYAELVLVKEGELTVTADGKSERAVGGDFILILPFVPHSYSSKTVCDFTMYTFSPSLISDFLDRTRGFVGERTVFRASDASYELFEKRFLRDEDYSEYTVRSCLLSMISDYVAKVKMVSAESENKHLLFKLFSYLSANLAKNPSLTEAARAIGYSANYISHIVKSSLGFGYLALLGILRTEEAKSMLTGTKKNSLDISIECGFGSERTFHRQFKRVTGMSPSEYRRSATFKVVNNDLVYPETIKSARK